MMPTFEGFFKSCSPNAKFRDAILRRDNKTFDDFLERDPSIANERFVIDLNDLERRELVAAHHVKSLRTFLGSSRVNLTSLQLTILAEDLPSCLILITKYNADISAEAWICETFMQRRKTCSSLHIAICLQSAGFVEYLAITVNHPIHLQSSINDRTPLDMALELGNIDILKTLAAAKPSHWSPGKSRPIIHHLKESNINDWETLSLAVKCYPHHIDVDDLTDSGLWRILCKLDVRDDQALLIVKDLQVRGYKMRVRLGFDRDTYLHCAVMNGAPKLVEFFISVGINVNAVNRCKESPLHFLVNYGNSCSQNSLHIFNLLLGNGADPQLKTRFGFTALEIAVKKNQVEFIKRLFPKETGPRKDGMTWLQYYIKSGVLSSEVISYFLQKSSIHCKDADGKGLLHTLLERPIWQDERKRFRLITFFTLLLELGANPSDPDKMGNNVLLTAMKQNLHLDVIRAILNHNSKLLDVLDAEGNNVLDVAVSLLKNDQPICDGIIKEFINFGLEPSIDDIKFALLSENLDLLDQLLCKDSFSDGLARRFPDAFLFLVQLINAKRKDLLQKLVMKFLDVYHYDVNYVDKNGDSPLTVLIEISNQPKLDSHSITLTRKLIGIITVGRNIDISSEHYLIPPLSLAVGKGDYECAKHLLMCAMCSERELFEAIINGGSLDDPFTEFLMLVAEKHSVLVVEEYVKAKMKANDFWEASYLKTLQNFLNDKRSVTSEIPTDGDQKELSGELMDQTVPSSELSSSTDYNTSGSPPPLEK